MLFSGLFTICMNLLGCIIGALESGIISMLIVALFSLISVKYPWYFANGLDEGK